jgi:hypothetical protein
MLGVVTSQLCKKTQVAIRVALAVYLAFWFALFTVLQVVHLSDSHHAHRFCEEHQQFEEVAREDGVAEGMLGTFPAVRGPASSPVATVHPGPSLTHVSCSILNYSTSRHPVLLLVQASVSVESAPGIARAFWRQKDFLCCPLLLTAPKTSPPFVTA